MPPHRKYSEDLDESFSAWYTFLSPSFSVLCSPSISVSPSLSVSFFLPSSVFLSILLSHSTHTHTHSHSLSRFCSHSCPLSCSREQHKGRDLLFCRSSFASLIPRRQRPTRGPCHTFGERSLRSLVNPNTDVVIRGGDFRPVVVLSHDHGNHFTLYRE
jgi:hypothetical protein